MYSWLFSKHYKRNAIIAVVVLFTLMALVQGVFVYHLSLQGMAILMLTMVGIYAVGAPTILLASRAVERYLQTPSGKPSAVSEMQPTMLGEANTEYTLRMEDVLDFFQHHYMDSTEVGRRLRLARRFFFVASAIALTMALVMVAAFDRQELTSAIVIGACAIWMLIVGVSFPLLTRKYISRVANRDYRREPNKLTGKHSLSITPHTVTDITDTGESTTRWDAVKFVISDDEYLFMSLTPATPVIVPRKAFADDAAFRRFADAVRTHHQAATETSSPPSSG